MRLLYACIVSHDWKLSNISDTCQFPLLLPLDSDWLHTADRERVTYALHASDTCILMTSVHGLPAAAGVVKNWWVGVEALHNLFVREHNRICGMLRPVGSPLPPL